jgi:predicted nucleic acid-binding protein
MKIALDTNLLIDFIEEIEPQASKIEKLLESFQSSENEGVISTITAAEILTGFYMASNPKGAETVKKQLNDLSLSRFKIVPVTLEIADLAANLRAKRGGKLPDALIAATAINQGCHVVYSRDNDFKRFSKDINVCELP